MEDKQPSKRDSMVIDVADVRSRMVSVRGQSVLLDRDVAALYGVETKHVNQAVRNNPRRFPFGYVIELSERELQDLRSKILTANISPKSRVPPKVFTERGLYMLATILKSERAERATLAIIETYAQLRSMNQPSQCIKESGVKINIETQSHSAACPGLRVSEPLSLCVENHAAPQRFRVLRVFRGSRSAFAHT